jgi:hypothetical protein
VATLVLFISLFLPWFTYNTGAGTVSVDGLWHGWMYVTLFISLAVIVYMLAKAGFNPMPVKLPIPEAQAILGATAINAVLSVIAFLSKPGGGYSGIGWGFGAVIGIVAAVVAAVPTAVPAFQNRTPR